MYCFRNASPECVVLDFTNGGSVPLKRNKVKVELGR